MSTASTIIALLTVFCVFTAFFTSKKFSEFAITIILSSILLFYYSTIIVGLSHSLHLDSVANFFIKVISFTKEKWLTPGQVSFLGINFETNEYFFNPSIWPTLIVITGTIIRLGVVRFVHRVKLQGITRQYWLFIITYIIFAFIVSKFTQIHFAAIIIISIAIFFLFMLGLFKVANDILNMIWTGIKNVFKIARLVWRYIVAIAVIIARSLKNITVWIDDAYKMYIVHPLQRLQSAFDAIINKAENNAQSIIDRNGAAADRERD